MMASQFRSTGFTGNKLFATIAVLGLLTTLPMSGFSQGRTLTPLAGHIPACVRESDVMGRMSGAKPLTLSLALPLRNQGALQEFLRRLYDPADPAYGHYLSSQEFQARFSPTPRDYARVAAYARSQGMTVVGTYSNRALLDVAAPAAVVESAFKTPLLLYKSRLDGQQFFAPSTTPSIPSALSGILSGVVGLSNAAVPRPYHHAMASAAPRPNNTGPNGGLAPFDINTAYNLTGVNLNGSGEVLGLVEYGGWHSDDLYGYQQKFGLPGMPIQNVSVDGSVYTDANIECTLDLELQMAVAPGIVKIVCYNGGSSAANTNRIASDNLAREVSCSWGIQERQDDAGDRAGVEAALQQMAAQGQSMFDATGDVGAYGTGNSSDGLSIDALSGHSLTSAVGGTSLSINSNSTYQSEVTAHGSGGGVSDFWTQPTWQQGVISSATRGSNSMRNTPDISLNMDNGYAIYVGGGWSNWGGTSCAAPLWSAFAALINQRRAQNRSGPIGCMNPALYAIGQSSSYGQDFHDIADGATNGYFPAVPGFDDTTGWGSFNGASLLADLVGSSGSNTLISGRSYRIVNAYSGKAVDNPNSSKTHGQALVQWTLNGGSNQNWIATDSGGGWTFVNAASNLAMDDYGWSNVNGGIIDQWDRNGLPVQTWKLVPVGDGSYKVINSYSGRLLDDSGASNADGAAIIQWQDLGGQNQHWRFQLNR